MSKSASAVSQDNFFKDFVSKVGETFFVRIFSMGIGLGVSILLARSLGPEGQGLYSVAMNFAAVITQLGILGLSTSNTYVSSKKRSHLPALIGNSISATILCGCFIIVCGWVLKLSYPSFIPVDGVLFTVALLWVFPGLLYVFNQALLLGTQSVRAYNILEIFFRSFHLILLFSVLFFLGLDVKKAFLVVFVAMSAVSIYSLVYIMKTSEWSFPLPSLRLFKSTAVYGMSAYLAGLFSFLCLRFDILMLKSLRGAEETGIYHIAVTLADMVYLFPVIFGTILFSKLSSMESFNAKKKFVIKVLFLLAAIMLVLVVVAALASKLFLVTLYGENYARSAEPFLYLLPGIFCLSLSTTIQNFIASIGRTWLMVVGPLLAFCLNFPLNLYFIPRMGANGAALASTISYGVWVILGMIILYRVQGRKENTFQFSEEGNDFALSVYTLPVPSLCSLRQKSGLNLKALEISNLVRKAGVLKLIFHLRKYHVRDFYVEDEKGEGSTVLNIFLTFSILARAQRLILIDGNGKQTVFLRGNMLKSLFSLLSSSLVCLYVAGTSYLQLHLMWRKNRKAYKASSNSDIFFLKGNLWFGVKAGGSIGHIAGIVNGFLRKGFGVTFGGISPPIMVDSSAKFMKLPYNRVLGYPVELNNYVYSRDMATQLFTAGKPTYRFIYQRLSLGNFAGVVLSRKWKIPLVLEYNGSEVWVSSHWGKKLNFHRLADLCEKVCLKHAHLIVTVSDVLRDELVEKGVPEERIVSYPNCVDPNIFDPERFTDIERIKVREDEGLSEKDTVFSFVGTFGKWHGVNILADAIHYWVNTQKAFMEKHNVRFLLVGDGSEMPYVRQVLDTPSCKPFVRFAGLIPQHMAPVYLSASDILLSPHIPNSDGSRFFGSPTKLFEYMIMERPIVVSNLEQLAEIFEGSFHIDKPYDKSSVERSSGILVGPGSIDSLLKAFEYLLENKEQWKYLTKNAKDSVFEKYTWDIHVDKILSGCERLNL